MIIHGLGSLIAPAFAAALTVGAPGAFAQGLAVSLTKASTDTAVLRSEGAPAGAHGAGPAESHLSARSGIAEELASWVTATDDNGDLPFMIVDKPRTRAMVFDAGGHLLGSAPVLIGLAQGDDTTPGIGKLKLAQISAAERTTPAGRFVTQFGDSDGHGTVLWVDLNDAIALHPVMSVSPDEHRFQRIKSPDPLQHRISYGCINVPKVFYDDVVLAALGGGAAVVYILPDIKPIGDVFPGFAAAIAGGGWSESRE